MIAASFWPKWDARTRPIQVRVHPQVGCRRPAFRRALLLGAYGVDKTIRHKLNSLCSDARHPRCTEGVWHRMKDPISRVNQNDSGFVKSLLKSFLRAQRISSRTAPVISLPVGPAPTIIMLRKNCQALGSGICSACSMAINKRQRISFACSRIFIGGTNARQFSLPKKVLQDPVVNSRWS